MQALMEQRLQGVWAELLVAARGATVRSIVETWGFANLGLFAARHRQRFGEFPSRTLGLARH